MTALPPGGAPALLPGVTVVALRETSQASPQGQIVQGQQITFRIPSGATSSIFIPQAQLSQLGAIANAINERAQSLMNIETLGGTS